MMERRIGSYRGRIQMTKTCKQNTACLAESQKVMEFYFRLILFSKFHQN